MGFKWRTRPEEELIVKEVITVARSRKGMMLDWKILSDYSILDLLRLRYGDDDGDNLVGVYVVAHLKRDSVQPGEKVRRLLFSKCICFYWFLVFLKFWIFGILNTYFSTTISVIYDLALLSSPVTTQWVRQKQKSQWSEPVTLWHNVWTATVLLLPYSEALCPPPPLLWKMSWFFWNISLNHSLFDNQDIDILI